MLRYRATKLPSYQATWLLLLNVILKTLFFNFFLFTTYVGLDGETDYWMDGVDDVDGLDGLDGVKPKLMLYDSPRGEKGNSPSEKPTCPT